MQEKTNIFYGIDWILIIMYILLVGFGWANIYAATYSETNLTIVNTSTIYGKQLIWILLSMPLILLVLFINTKSFERFGSILYLVSILSLIGLFFFGKEINGAKSWYSFGGMSLQPSEFAKVFTALALAKLLSDRKYNLNLVKNQIKAFIIIFLPTALIGVYDPGSALVFFSFFFALNREGLTLKYLIFSTIAIILFLLTIAFGVKIVLTSALIILTFGVVYIFYRNKNYFRFNWFKVIMLYVVSSIFILGINYTYNNLLKQHHRDRFEILLGLKTDIKRIGYNTDQSIQTISSGGLLGKGFLQGDKTRGRFVPEQETDYIFSVVGEEWGFLGSSLVIFLFAALILRVINLSEKHPNKFGRIYGYGVASILFFHLIVNVGMVIGILPTIGIPLPFFSYGGSSLWGFTILLFIFIKIDANKRYDL